MASSWMFFYLIVLNRGHLRETANPIRTDVVSPPVNAALKISNSHGEVHHTDAHIDIPEKLSEHVVNVQGVFVHGEQISPWNGSHVLGNDGNHTCERHTLSLLKDSSRLRGVNNGTSSIAMCLRDYSDTVSDSIRAHGRWSDCDVNEQLWNSLPGKGDIFVDIGANIGACTLPMLSHIDVNAVVAFEPNPSNLFYLTTSVLSNSGYKDRLRLFPIGLGEERSRSEIHSQDGNAGNTIVGKGGLGAETAHGLVDVWRLDDIVKLARMAPIRVMKMDAQGFEVHILKGADILLKSGSVAAIHFELWEKGLALQNSSAAELVSMLISNKYSIHRTAVGGSLQNSHICEVIRNLQGGFIELIAKYTGVTQKPLECSSSGTSDTRRM